MWFQLTRSMRGILMILRPVGFLRKMQKKSLKRYLSKQLRSILVMEKKIYFLVRDTEKQDIKVS